MKKQLSLTEGDVTAGLLRFSIPFLLTNILQACYGASDLFMVGHFSDAVGVSAVATGGQVMQMITGLVIGMTAGGTVIIARHFGAKRRSAVANAAATVLILFGALSFLMTAATALLVTPICRLMQVPPDAFQTTREYLLICSAGICFIVAYNAVCSILRGLGDSKTPLLFMIAACIINVSTDLLFVGVLRMGAPGAAVSTVIAQAASVLLILIYLSCKGFLRRYRSRKPCFVLRSARDILGVGLPIALQEGLVNFSFLIITAVINTLGLIASAAVGVVEKLIAFSMLPPTAVASAVAAMTAQNIGAGQPGRAHQCRRTGIRLSLLFGVAFYLCAQLNAIGLVSFFTNDPLVIQAGALYLRSYSLDCMLVCFVFSMNSYFSGSGHPVFPLVHSLISTLLLRIPLSYHFSRLPGAGLYLVGFAAPAASLLSVLLSLAYLRLQREKRPIKSSTPLPQS